MWASDNKMQSLDMFNTSDTFEILVYIDMGMNPIHMFDVTMLRRMSNLLELYLHDNKLTHINDFRIYYKKVITLAGNPWHCGMSLSWMDEGDMAFEDRLVCETPDYFAHMSKYNKRQHIQHVQVSVLQENLQWQPIVLSLF